MYHECEYVDTNVRIYFASSSDHSVISYDVGVKKPPDGGLLCALLFTWSAYRHRINAERLFCYEISSYTINIRVGQVLILHMLPGNLAGECQ